MSKNHLFLPHPLEVEARREFGVQPGIGVATARAAFQQNQVVQGILAAKA